MLLCHLPATKEFILLNHMHQITVKNKKKTATALTCCHLNVASREGRALFTEDFKQSNSQRRKTTWKRSAQTHEVTPWSFNMSNNQAHHQHKADYLKSHIFFFKYSIPCIFIYQTSLPLHQLNAHFLFITYLYHTSPTCFGVSQAILRENIHIPTQNHLLFHSYYLGYIG